MFQFDNQTNYLDRSLVTCYPDINCADNIRVGLSAEYVNGLMSYVMDCLRRFKGVVHAEVLSTGIHNIFGCVTK